MHRSKDHLYQCIQDLKTKTEFDEEIKKRQKEYDYLLNEDTIALLIVDELGRNKHSISTIKDLKPNQEHTFFGRAIEIGRIKEFTRKNGSIGRVVHIEITDGTSKCLLVLWDKKVELVTTRNIQYGTNVKVINGYVKKRHGELQVYLGRWGLLELEPEDMPPLLIQKTPCENETIEGRVKEIDPTHAFFKDDGRFGFVTTLKIQDKKDIVHILTIWDEKIKELRRFQVGERIRIKNVGRRQKNGRIEMHVNGRSEITRL